MLENDYLLNFIKEKCKELGVTGYDIGKNTKITEQSAYKILDGTTKNPRRKNLLNILEYLESRVLGSNLQNKNELKEPEEIYISKKDYTIYDCMKEKVDLIKEIDRLSRLLEKNNILH